MKYILSILGIYEVYWVYLKLYRVYVYLRLFPQYQQAGMGW